MGSDKETFSNDATKKLLGYDYQKLIALEKCLNAKKNEYIWIECFGDVASTNESIEVKHHNEDHNLSSNSEDLWKTLKNYAVEYETVIDFDKLILFTTSYIKDTSMFFDWNEKTPSVKYTLLKKHVPAEGIKNFKKEFFDLKKDDAIKLLKKFHIISEQPKIAEKWEELKEHSTFSLIPEGRRDEAIKYLYGYITKKAIDNKDKWEININDFKSDITFGLRGYTHDNIPFPVAETNELGDEIDNRNFVFIDKLKKIEINENGQANAVADYLRANISAERLLAITPTISDSLFLYDEDVKRTLQDEKDSVICNLNIEDFSNGIAKKEAKSVYYNSIKKEHPQINGVSNTQRYYRNGRIHQTLENTDYNWEFKESEL